MSNNAITESEGKLDFRAVFCLFIFVFLTDHACSNSVPKLDVLAARVQGMSHALVLPSTFHKRQNSFVVPNVGAIVGVSS